ncbi:hypothetical protein Patl1_22202 [Pistacia atlantica]|uniref:Uncharacterized protein n=1 Tax=Pistacia atlantica TaxID=434234 RepID=A0ACC1BHD9_9ROSI|nr:hypothetical protein Patl1_22202 [Pistacia atlantica]
MEEKKKQAKGVEDFEGYGADPLPGEGQFLDWSDRLFLEVYPEILNYGQKNQNLSGAFMVPMSQVAKGILEEYSIKMKNVTELASKAMAKSLNIKENCFLTQFAERAQHKARFNYYLRCQKPDLVLGLKPHSDVSGFTIILMDEESLQVLKDEQWFTVPKITEALLVLVGDQMEALLVLVGDQMEALLVLVGDQMEIMTNGIFKSPVHRVVTSSERERISIAVFYSPEANKEIGPEDGLINEETPRIFKNVKGYPDIYQGYYKKGQRALHVAKV